jgi:hypothetical protein
MHVSQSHRPKVEMPTVEIFETMNVIGVILPKISPIPIKTPERPINLLDSAKRRVFPITQKYHNISNSSSIKFTDFTDTDRHWFHKFH